MFPVKTAEERMAEHKARLEALASKALPVTTGVIIKPESAAIPEAVKSVAEQLDGLSVADILSLGDTEQVHALRLKSYETKADKKGNTRTQYSLFDTWSLLPVKVIDGVKIMAKYQIVLIPEPTPTPAK